MAKRTESFRLLKEKATTILYGEETDAARPPIFEKGKCYVSKWAFDGQIPERISITIDYKETK
jgi:hypothetical protein